MSIPNHPYVVETPEQIEALTSTVNLFLMATEEGPALVWEDVNGDAWHAIRALNEDDWAAGRRRLGQEVAVDLDPETAGLPFTVLWHDGMWPRTTSPGLALVDAEIHRVRTVEGYTAEHDAQHPEEMALAAACYAIPNSARRRYPTGVPHLWPWANEFWKPVPDDRVRELVKAGQLIAAEIDRLLAAGGATPLIAAGAYRSARTGAPVTTAAEHAGLPVGSVVRNLSRAIVAERISDEHGAVVGNSTACRWADLWSPGSDITILFRPDAPQPAPPDDALDEALRCARGGLPAPTHLARY